MKIFNYLGLSLTIVIVLYLSGCAGEDDSSSAENIAPIALAETITVEYGSSDNNITLHGTDADGDSLTYIVETNTTHGTLNGIAPNLTYTPIVNFSGNDSFTYKVNDGRADSATVTINIRVNMQGNQVPVADAGVDQTVIVGDSVAFDASSSSDDGTIVSYVWSENTTQLSTAMSFSKSDFTVGTHFITLTVTDNQGITATDEVIITVNDTTPVTIIDNGITYKTVISPYTQKVWLDRNLGASRACTAPNDIACYGDYYQWGRNDDGHEKLTSEITSTLSTNINNAGTKFITSSTSPFDWTSADYNGSLRTTYWSKTDGTSICPVGYRIPTKEELRAETTSATPAITDNIDAFNSFLKLPSAGGRSIFDGSMYNQGSGGRVWSSNVVNDSDSIYLHFDSSNVNLYTSHRGYGFSVRCIKE